MFFSSLRIILSLQVGQLDIQIHIMPHTRLEKCVCGGELGWGVEEEGEVGFDVDLKIRFGHSCNKLVL